MSENSGLQGDNRLVIRQGGANGGGILEDTIHPFLSSLLFF